MYKSLRTFKYPEFAEAHAAVLQSPWSHYEVTMASDINDWNNSLSSVDKYAIGTILKGFTLIEQCVSEYWRERVLPAFKDYPEIVALSTAFSHQEQIHMFAYDFLEASLGLDTFEAFKQDEVALAKLNWFLNSRDLALSLAVFSGLAEGVSLFGSFAVLLSYSRLGLLKSMTQILSWSVIDETLHSRMGTRLFHLLPTTFVKPPAKLVVDSFEAGVVNEFKVLEQVFAQGDLAGITHDEAKNFVLHRANNRLEALGYEKSFSEDAELVEKVCSWFYPLVRGGQHNDFFALSKNGAAYSPVLTQDFNSINYKEFA